MGIHSIGAALAVRVVAFPLMLYRYESVAADEEAADKQSQQGVSAQCDTPTQPGVRRLEAS